MRWWVIRGGALGDFVLTLPALSVVRDHASALTLYASPRYAALRPDLVDRVIDLHGPEALALYGAGRPPEPLPDAALVYTPGVADQLRAWGVPRVLETTPLPPPGRHAAAHLHAPVAHLGPLTPPRLRPDPDRVARLSRRLPGPRPIVLAPGAAGTGKIWTGFRETALALAGAPLIWVPGRDEAAPPAPPGALALELDLPDLVALAACCGAWLGNDTGTSHVAAATAGGRTTVVFGPTDPAQWAPPEARALSFSASPENLAQTLLADRKASLYEPTIPTPSRPD